VQEEQDLFQLDGDACVQQLCFVETYVDKRHDVRCLYAKNSDAAYDTHHPNRTEKP
jgi:hypothetical protein